MKTNTKREQAEARQVKYDALSDEEKLTQLEARPGNSTRERERILKRM